MSITYLDEPSVDRPSADEKPKITYLDEPKVQYTGDERKSTGEDVFNLIARNPKFAQDLNAEEYVALRNYKEQHPVSFLTQAKDAGSAILGTIGNAVNEYGQASLGMFPSNPEYLAQNPSKFREVMAPVETAGRGVVLGLSTFGTMVTKGLESAGNWIDGLTDDNLNSYQRFLANNGLKDTADSKKEYHARVNRALTSFKEFAGMDQMNAELASGSPYPATTEAISYVAQPELGVGAVLEGIGAGARLSQAASRATMLSGDAIEKLGKAGVFSGEALQNWTRNAVEKVTDSSSAARRAAGRVKTVLTPAELAARTVQTTGEVIKKVSENIAKGESRIGAFEALGRDLTATAPARTVGNIGAALGADAVAPYIGAATRGAVEGAAIGAGLGYITDGEDGAASGLGSGLVFGAGGALAGRGYRDATGATRDAQVINDSVRSLQGMTPESVVNGARLMDTLIREGNGNAAAELADTRNFLRGDVDWHYVNDEQAKGIAGGVTFEGVTIKNDGQRPSIYINVDRFKPGTGFHEGLHGALRTALGDKFGPMLADAVQTHYTPEEIAKFKKEYVDRAGNNAIMRQELEAKMADPKYLHEEMGAEFFRQFLQKPENLDMLLRGRRTNTGGMMNYALNAIDASLRYVGYRDEVKPRNTALTKTVEDLVKARTAINKEIAKGGKPTVEVPLAKMPTERLETWAKQTGQGDVLIKDEKGNTVGVKTEDQVEAARDAAYSAASLDLANLPRGNGILTDAELAVYHKHLPPDHFAKLVFINDAIKRGLTVGMDYFPATKKSDETSVYASRGMTTREAVPYKITIGKRGQVLISYLDVSQLRARFDDMMSRKGVADLWQGDRAKAWADVLDYSKNLAQGEGKARPSAELFGAAKRDVLNKVYGFVPTREQANAGVGNKSSLGTNTRRESGTGPERIGQPLFQDSTDTRTVGSARLDRLGSLTDRGASLAFNESGSYNLSQVNFKPAQNIGNGRVFDSEDGYRIIEKNGRFSLFDKAGKRIGIYGSAEEASAKAAKIKETAEAIVLRGKMTPEEFLSAAVGNPDENLRMKLSKRPGTGVAKNKFIEFQDKSGRPIGVGATSEFGGKPFDVWRRETEQWLSDKDVGAFRHWYNELHDKFVGIFGQEKAGTMMMAWLAAQQNVSPGGALGNVFKVEDRLAGIGTGKKGGLADEKIQGVLTQTVPEKGFGAKLTDFVDAGFLKNQRTYMGGDPRGGRPFVADVHTGRDSGHVDQQTLSRLSDKSASGDLFINGKPAAVKITQTKTVKTGNKVSEVPTRVLVKVEGMKPFGLETDMTGSPGNSQYEGISEWGNNLTDHLNRIGWKGGNWTPAEVQAVGWMRVLRQYGLPEPTVASALAQNTSRVYAEVNYGSGAMLPRSLPEFGKIPLEVQQSITKDVMEQMIPTVAKTIGGSLRVQNISMGDGVFGGQKAPSVAIELLGSPESVDMFALTLAHVSEQAATMSAIFGVGGKDSRSLRFKKADGSRFTDSEISSLVNDAQIGGFSVHQLPGGTEALITDSRADYTPKAFTEKKMLRIFDRLNGWTNKTGVALDVDAPPTKVTSYANDWSSNQEGQKYTDLVNKRGGASKVREIAGLRGQYRTVLEQAFDRHAPGLRQAGAQGQSVGSSTSFLPAENLPHGSVLRTQNNYSVVKKDGGKFRVYSPTGLLIGVAESLEKAQRIISKHQ